MTWLDLIPRWLLLALLAVTVAACVACRIELARTHLQLAQLQAAIATERAQAADAGRLATERFRAQEQRTAAAGQEITNATIQATAVAGRAAARAAVSGGRLRKRAEAVAARCNRAPEGAAVTQDSQATTSAGNLPTDVLGRLEETGRQLAAIADARGVAGSDCERRYDALEGR